MKLILAQSSGSGEDIEGKVDAFGESLSAKLLSSAMLRLTPFSNAPGQDLEEWLQKYEYAATGQGWDKAKMAARVGSYLAGPARAWYTVNVKDNTAGPFGWDKLVEMMAKAFLATGYQVYLTRERPELIRADFHDILHKESVRCPYT
jgi:hypothetical protein